MPTQSKIFKRLGLPREISFSPILKDQPFSKSLIENATSYQVLLNSNSFTNLMTEIENILCALDARIKVDLIVNVNRDRASEIPAEPRKDLISLLQSFDDIDLLAEKFSLGLEENLLKLRFCNLQENQQEIEYHNYAIISASDSTTLMFSNDLEADQKIDYQVTLNESRIKVDWPWGDPNKKVLTHINCLNSFLTKDEDPYQELNNSFDISFIEELQSSSTSSVGLRPHQEEAIQNWFKNNYHGIYAMCTGAGKTIAALDTIRQLQEHLQKEQKELRTVVIICPLKVLVEQWFEEVQSQKTYRYISC